MKIAVVGLGKLGLVLAALYAESGHSVVGFDIDAQRVRQVNGGTAPFQEPGLQDVIDAAGAQLTATSNIAAALSDAEVTYVLVPTPSGRDGAFSNTHLVQALQAIGHELRRKASRHTVVVGSTVMPGSCNGPLRTALEESSGKELGPELGLVYSPEFIALGSVVHDMRHPDMVLIGESDAESGKLVKANAHSIIRSAPAVHRMNLVNAELTKIAVNTYVTTKISFANMLAEICDALPGADVNDVTGALGSDTRIGRKYLTGALGYGGPCFPRDNVALSALGRKIHVPTTLAVATDEVNRRQVSRAIKQTCDAVPPPGPVAVLGLAYKPETDVCDESQGIQIAQALLERSYDVIMHDPLVDTSNLSELPNARVMPDLHNAIDVARLVLISTPDSVYQAINPRLYPRTAFIDFWGILPSYSNVIQPGRAGKPA